MTVSEWIRSSHPWWLVQELSRPRWSWDTNDLPSVLDAVVAAKRTYKPRVEEKDDLVRATLDRWVVKCIAIRDSVPLLKVWFRMDDGTLHPIALLDRNNPYRPNDWWVRP